MQKLFKSNLINRIMIKEEKGQFYIILAVIIIVIIVASLTIFNYARTAKNPVKFYDLSDELGIESESVINYGIYQEKYTDYLVENFTDTYSDYFELLAGKSDLVFVYGDEKNMTMLIYSNITKGRVSLSLGDSKTYIDVTGKEKQKVNLVPKLLPAQGDYVLVNISDRTYNFTLHKGENFFFVLTKSIGNETHVTQG